MTYLTWVSFSWSISWPSSSLSSPWRHLSWAISLKLFRMMVWYLLCWNICLKIKELMNRNRFLSIAENAFIKMGSFWISIKFSVFRFQRRQINHFASIWKIRAKTIEERTRFCEKHASFETAALFSLLCRWAKNAAISKLACFLQKRVLSYIVLALVQHTTKRTQYFLRKMLWDFERNRSFLGIHWGIIINIIFMSLFLSS